jgi:hypothetical protein
MAPLPLSRRWLWPAALSLQWGWPRRLASLAVKLGQVLGRLAQEKRREQGDGLGPV